MILNAPVLLGAVDLRAAGMGTRMLLGDLDGDGRREILMVQPDGGIDDRYVPHQVQCLTAFDLEGRLLWQAGTPDPRVRGSGSDIPAQIWDLDGDGRNKILCVMEEQFLVLDGATGVVRERHDLPDPDAHDCIIVANFTGGERPQDILLKDRYRRLWALDRDFNTLWSYHGNPGHYPWPHDLDGDGRDEVMAGYDLLDHDGTKLWSCRDLGEHADCIWVGSLEENGEAQIVIGGTVTVGYDRHGVERWRYENSIESQHVALGRFRSGSSEVFVAGLDRIVRGRDGGKDALFLLSADGEEIWKEDRTTPGWLTIIETLHNWDGAHDDHVLAYRRGGGLLPALYAVEDGRMRPVVTFPTDGHVAYADLLGHDRQDVIVYTRETAFIYSSRPGDLSAARPGVPLPQNKRLSHATLYPGGEFPEA
jgi:hypothetical protein